MKLLQRYILGELIRVFGLLVVVLTIMLVFVGLFREATERGLGPVQILQIMPFVVPSMLPFTIPATLLLSVCVVYGRISADLEVIAAKAAGISAMRMLAPAFLFGTVLAVASFGLTNYAIPWAVANIERIVTQAVEDIFIDMLRTQHLVSEPSRGYSITVHDVQNRTLIDATFRFRTHDHHQITVRAEAARIHFDLERQQIELKLRNATYSNPGADSFGDWDGTVLHLPLPPQIHATKARHLTVADLTEKTKEAVLQDEIGQIQQANEAAMLMLTGDFHQFGGKEYSQLKGANAEAVRNQRRFKTEIHSRVAMAFSCLFFTLVGGPFSMLQARRQFITSFIMCFLPILLIYYPVMFLMVNLCKSGTLDPTWSMWVPNGILLIAGAMTLRKVMQH
ncbi:MAG: LptF/LptG family permease [Planctomycetaceae bacterium]|nr:LptF/LptG family permease [Planctomycetaceae bacterium]